MVYGWGKVSFAPLNCDTSDPRDYAEETALSIFACRIARFLSNLNKWRVFGQIGRISLNDRLKKLSGLDICVRCGALRSREWWVFLSKVGESIGNDSHCEFVFE